MIDLWHAAGLVAALVALWLGILAWRSRRDLIVPESREKTLSTGDLYQTWKASKEGER